MSSRSKRGLIAGCAILAGLTATSGLAHATGAGYYMTAPSGGYYMDASSGGYHMGHGGSAGRPAGKVTIAGNAPIWARPEARIGDVAGNQVRRVQVALALRDEHGAEALAEELSTPGTPRNGKYLSDREFMRRFGPTRQSVHGVSRWLRSQGLTVDGVSENRHFVTAVGTTSTLENAFEVSLSTFRSDVGGRVRSLVAPDRDASVPESLRGSITAVLGLDDSTRIVPQHARSAPKPWAEGAGDEGCARYWGERNNGSVPQKYRQGRQSNMICGYNSPQIRAMYGLGGTDTGARQRVGIVGAYNLDSIVLDTNRAATTFGAPPLSPTQYESIVPRDGFTDEQECASESWHFEQAMDVQAVHTVAPDARIIYYGARSCATQDMFAAVNKAVADNDVSIISNSWGAPGESVVPPAALRQFGAIAVQAAVQGQAVVFSSGDVGDGSGAGKREASFPASHPWVTAAGGTTVGIGADNQQRVLTGWESAGNTLTANRWRPQRDGDGPFAGGAGGGVSAAYDQPAYQKGRVPASFARGKRAIPDVAALADAYTGFGMGYTTAERGYAEMSGGGTSLAAPLLAGIVADTQQHQGKDRLGFLNPALYKVVSSKVIADVTPQKAGIWTPTMAAFAGTDVPHRVGNYLIDADTRPQTLQSASGWDNVTGVGTPTRGFTARFGK